MYEWFTKARHIVIPSHRAIGLIKGRKAEGGRMRNEGIRGVATRTSKDP